MALESDAGETCCLRPCSYREPDSALGFSNSEFIRWQVKSAFTYETGTKKRTPSRTIRNVFFSLRTTGIALIVGTKPFVKRDIERDTRHSDFTLRYVSWKHDAAMQKNRGG